MKKTFAVCPCQNCGKQIEFDRSELGFAKTRTIECPHCQQETVIFDPKDKSESVIPAPPEPEEKPGTAFLTFACFVMFAIGLGTTITGFQGYYAAGEDPAWRTMYVVQYSSGFVLIALGLILSALVRLIRKE